MRKTYLLAAGAALALSMMAAPTNAAPLSHSGLADQQDANPLVDTVRHRWRHRHRGRHYGWYGPPRRYGYYGYRRPYWDRPHWRRPYYGRPGISLYFGTGPRPYYW